MKKILVALAIFIMSEAAFSQSEIRELVYFERSAGRGGTREPRLLGRRDIIDGLTEIRHDSTLVLKVAKGEDFQQLNFLVREISYFLKAADGEDLVKTQRFQAEGPTASYLEEDFFNVKFDGFSKEKIDGSILTLNLKLLDRDTGVSREEFRQFRLRVYHVQVLFNVSDVDNLPMFLEGAVSTGRGITLDFAGAHVDGQGWTTVTIVHVPAISFDTKTVLLRDFEIGFIAPLDLLADTKVIGYGGDLGFLKATSGATAVHLGAGLMTVDEDRFFYFFGLNLGAFIDYIANLEL